MIPLLDEASEQRFKSFFQPRKQKGLIGSVAFVILRVFDKCLLQGKGTDGIRIFIKVVCDDKGWNGCGIDLGSD
jgi:hypothetical protein